MKNQFALTLDRAGMVLSMVCLIHCLAMPFVLMALPLLILKGYTHPIVHFGLAFFIVPIGFWAFIRGFRHHGRKNIFVLGVLGLLIVGVFPLFADLMEWHLLETWVVSLGSLLLVAAHWKNQRACACDNHHH